MREVAEVDMTLDKKIKQLRGTQERAEKYAPGGKDGMEAKALRALGEDSKQLADWLEELKRYKDAEAGKEKYRQGKWLLEAHKELNYRWSVTAECSECCNKQTEIWAGFFPNVPDLLARDVALISAGDIKTAKPGKYCPDCGARMDGECEESKSGIGGCETQT